MACAWQPYCFNCFHFKISSFHVALWSVLCTGLLLHGSLGNGKSIKCLLSSSRPSLICYIALLSYGQQSHSLSYCKSRYIEIWDHSSHVQFHPSDKSNCITSTAALMCPTFLCFSVTLFYVINHKLRLLLFFFSSFCFLFFFSLLELFSLPHSEMSS